MDVNQSNLDAKAFIQMFERDATTELEIACFKHLAEIFDMEESERAAAKLIDEVYGVHDEILEEVENTLDGLEDDKGFTDKVSDSVAMKLHDLSQKVCDERATAKKSYDELELLGLWD